MSGPLHKEIYVLKAENERLKAENKQLKTENEAVIKDCCAYEREIEQLKVDNVLFDADNAIFTECQKKLADENKHLKAEKQRQYNTITEAWKQRDQLKTTIENLESEIAEKDEHIRYLGKNYDHWYKVANKDKYQTPEARIHLSRQCARDAELIPDPAMETHVLLSKRIGELTEALNWFKTNAQSWRNLYYHEKGKKQGS